MIILAFLKFNSYYEKHYAIFVTAAFSGGDIL